MVLSQAQIEIVRSTAPILKEHGNHITSNFYSTLLSENPSLNDVFNQTNQLNNHQATALATALYAYATNIDNLGALGPAVQKICYKHASLNIRPEQYEVVGVYLLRSMGEVLGSALTSEILEAWKAAYWELANLMIAQERQLYDSTNGWVGWRDFEISDKVKESDEITSFYLRPLDKAPLPPFKPGQYVSVLSNIPALDHVQSRQYSLSEAPNQEYYRISVKREPGVESKPGNINIHPGFLSNVLHHDKKPGDVVKVSHPFGDFFLDVERQQNGPIVLLSAGVGITPMISILNTLVQKGYQEPITCVHSARTVNIRAFAEHCYDIAAKNSNVTYKSFVSNATGANEESQEYDFPGRLSLDTLDNDKLYLNDGKTLYFVCGPETFMVDMHHGLTDRGVDSARVRMELFGTGSLPES